MAKADSTPDKKSSKELSAHSIWLAGLGALAAAEDEGTRLFSQLVQRGRSVEALGRKISGEQSDWVKIISQRGRVHVIQGVHSGPRSAKPNPDPKKTPATTPSAAEIANLRRNAQARRAFLAEFGTLTSREVAEVAGSRAANRAALANRWRTEGRIFAVEIGGQTLFPAFQFSDDDGQPRKVIAKILKVLQPKLSGWQTALWFTGRNGWLGARRPVDVLGSDPEAVAEAARRFRPYTQRRPGKGRFAKPCSAMYRCTAQTAERRAPSSRSAPCL